jgi:hypothetical protein
MYNEREMTTFTDALVAAVSARGTILAVAEDLGVAPQRVYRWIAGVDLPDTLEQHRLMQVLRASHRGSRAA